MFNSDFPPIDNNPLSLSLNNDLVAWREIELHQIFTTINKG